MTIHGTAYTENTGATFTLLIPASKSHSRAESETYAPLNSKVETTGSELEHKRNTVLVIEDEKEVREIATLFFAQLGFRVLEAGNSIETKEQLPSGHPIDLIFTDVLLGTNENGISLSQEVLSHFPQAKVIFMSHYAPRALSNEIQSTTNGEIVLKQYTLVSLQTAIAKVFR